MRRGVWVAGPVAGVVAVLGSWWVAGVAGLLSGLLGVVLGIGSALFTLWLMHRTADREPRAVMVASLGGFLQKMIILLVALWLAVLADMGTSIAVTLNGLRLFKRGYV